MAPKKVDILLITKRSKHSTTGFYVMNQIVENTNFNENNLSIINFGLYSIKKSNKIFDTISSLIKVLYYFLKLFATLLIYRPKLVYFTISPVNTFLRDLIYVFVLKMFKIKLVFHLHGKGIKDKCESKIYHKLYRWAYKNVDVICLSKKLVSDFDFLPFKHYYILPNSVTEECALPLKRERRENDALKVIFLSNLIKSKGVLDYADSLKIAQNNGMNVLGTIIGHEADLSSNELQTYIGESQNIIKYLGPMYGRDKMTVLSQNDVLIFPTYYKTETWGLVILEAMQLGLAVIATDEGGITDMIEDGVNGFIVEKNNPQDIFEKIQIFDENPHLVREMGQRNILKVQEKFSTQTFETNIITIFNDILS